MVGELKTELASLREAPKKNEKKIEELWSQLASAPNTIGHLATPVKDHRLGSLCVAAENGELWRKMNDTDEKAAETELSVEQLQAKVSGMAEKLNFLITKRDKRVSEVQCLPGLANEAKNLDEPVAKMKEASKTKELKVRTKRKTAGMEVVTEQARTEHVEHTTRISKLKGDLHEL